MEYFINLLSYLKIIFIVSLLGLLIYFLVNIGNKFLDEEKKFRITKKHITYFLLTLLGLATFYYLFFASSIMSEIMGPVITSIVFAYLLNPLINFLENKGLKRLWGVLLVYVILIVAIILISVSIFPKVAGELQNLIKMLPDYFEDMSVFFKNIYEDYSKNLDKLPEEFQSINEVIRENFDRLQNYLVSSFKSITSSIINMFSKIISFIIIPVLTFYFLKDKDFFKKKIILTIPKNMRNETIRISREIDGVLGKFIRGQLIVATFVGINTAIGLLIIGVDFALTIGLIAGMANVIPYFGPIIGIFPALTFALLDDPIKGIWVILLFILVQQIESNILSPKIVGESVGLHPVIVIISLIIGGNVLGILGMLLAVPVAAIIRIITSFVVEKLTKV
ncbi:AI-2E family transporter [Dethiothermospora halolimnae]|uniref:AI-2E family transporter n=1 Tax=Dethiothermospora halolimnae TaxID=3114390 RepID=UPI003CCC1898